MSSVTLLLTPSNDGASRDLAALRSALDHASCPWTEAPSAIDAAGYGALLLPGGMGVAGFMASEGDEPLSSEIARTVRAFHDGGRWIGAPCLALAVALEALAGPVGEGRAQRRELDGEVVVFPDLRLVSTNRPLLGRSGAELEGIVRALVSTLISAAQRANAAGDASQPERQF